MAHKIVLVNGKVIHVRKVNIARNRACDVHITKNVLPIFSPYCYITLTLIIKKINLSITFNPVCQTMHEYTYRIN